ncbi:MAG: hypothetical protein ABL874_01700 [Sphingopyxis sp.]
MIDVRGQWWSAAGSLVMLLVLGGATLTDGVIGIDRWVEQAGAYRAGSGHDTAIAIWQVISWSGGGSSAISSLPCSHACWARGIICVRARCWSPHRFRAS